MQKQLYKVTNYIEKILNDRSMGETIYLWALFMYLISAGLEGTMFEKPALLKLLLGYIPLVFMLFKLVWYDKHTLGELVLYVALLSVGVMCILTTGVKHPLVWLIVVICAKNVSFEKVLKIWLLASILVVGSAFVGSLIGVVIDLKWDFDYSGNEAQDVAASVYSGVRHGFGIVFPTDFAAHIFNIMLVGFYLIKDRIKISYLIGGTLITLGIYRYTHARLDCGCMIMLCIGYLLKSFGRAYVSPLKLKYRERDNSALILICAMPVGAGVMYTLSKLYTSDIKFFITLDRVLSERLYWGNIILNKYRLNAFGHKTDFNGYGGKKFIGPYEFADCSYIYIAILYGAFFLFIVLIMCIVSEIRYQDDFFFLFSMVLIAINACIAHHLSDLSYTIFIIACMCKRDNNLELKT